MRLGWIAVKWGTAVWLAAVLLLAGVGVLWTVLAELATTAVMGIVWLCWHEAAEGHWQVWWQRHPPRRSREGYHRS